MLPEIALPGGSLLIEEAAPGARSFAVGFWFPLGSRHEAEAERGFTHFVEHLVFKGSRRRSAQDFARDVDRVGGYLNAFTERDTLCFHCVVPREAWRLALDVLVDLVFNATFPASEFDKEREVISSEILASNDDPEEASHDAFMARIWPGDPMGRKIAGEVEDLEAATRDGLFAYYRRELRPDRLLVTASHGLPPGEVEAELARLLAGLEPRDAVAPRPLDPAPAFRPGVYSLKDGISQAYLYSAFQFPPSGLSADYDVLSVLNGALGESMSSRLFQHLREGAGLCYSVYSTFSLDRSLGLWLASASSTPRNFPALLEGLEAELGRLAGGGEGALSEEEVGESVSRIVGSFELALEDPEYRMRRLARQRLCEGLVHDVDETVARLRAVDTAQVARLAAGLFSLPRATFGYGKLTAGAEKALEALA